MKKLLPLILIAIVSCTKKNETEIETYSLLSENTVALNKENTDNENYIYRNFCNQHKEESFCVELTSLRNAGKDFLSATDSINLAKDDFDALLKMYATNMEVIRSIHDKYADTGTTKINVLSMEHLKEDKERAIILMRSSVILSKHKAFGVLASQISICPPLAENKKCSK
ncbi:hypothetical protein [Cytophaga aurantiaca]|uniref:hypothetical protein n=1 Tax=Cytophaga aurantiaca TaxID=29530 RepID=UPI00037A0161|nr:hypothetical protein [Cytophaga aurantiaca]